MARKAKGGRNGKSWNRDKLSLFDQPKHLHVATERKHSTIQDGESWDAATKNDGEMLKEAHTDFSEHRDLSKRLRLVPCSTGPQKGVRKVTVGEYTMRQKYTARLCRVPQERQREVRSSPLATPV